MKFSTIALSIMAALVVAAPVGPDAADAAVAQAAPEVAPEAAQPEAPKADAPAVPKLEDLPKQLQDLPKGVLKNVLFSDDKEQFLVVEDNHGTRHVIVVDKTREGAGAEALAKREADPEAWRWYWVPGYGEPNWKRDAMPADANVDNVKREASPEAWRWYWVPGYGEPNWKRDAMPAPEANPEAEASPEAWRWYWVPGYGEPNW